MISAMEDKFAIEELVARYNQSLDQGRYEEFLACWCEDGVFDGLGGPYVGKVAIRRFTDGYDANYRLRLNGLRRELLRGERVPTVRIYAPSVMPTSDPMAFDKGAIEAAIRQGFDDAAKGP